MEETRQELADAANSVDGVACHPYFLGKSGTKAGSALVRYVRTNYPNRLGGIETWSVWVVLTADIATAERWMDQKVPLLVEALNSVMTVQTVTPQTFVFDNGDVPGLSIEGTR